MQHPSVSDLLHENRAAFSPLMVLGRRTAAAVLEFAFALILSSLFRVTDGFLPFTDGDVAVDWRRRDALDEGARRGPPDFEPIHFRAGTDAEDHARVVRRKIAPTANLLARAFQIARLPGDLRSDSICIRFLADEAEPEPMIRASGVVAEEKPRLIVVGD